MKKLNLLWKIIKRCNLDKTLYTFIIFFLISSLIILIAEPNINTYKDSLWYLFVSTTTIGYGDIVPETSIVKIITSLMVLFQIIIVAIIPGIVVTYYMEIIHRREKETVTLFLEKLENLPNLSKEELEQISKKVKSIK